MHEYTRLLLGSRSAVADPAQRATDEQALFTELSIKLGDRLLVAQTLSAGTERGTCDQRVGVTVNTFFFRVGPKSGHNATTQPLKARPTKI